MRVLLVNPLQVNLVNKKGRIYNRKWPPLDLANCAALLEEERVEVRILDANAEQIGPQEVGRRALGFDKVFVTSTSLDRWQCPQLDLNPFLETVHVLNGVVPEVYVAGSHGTVRPAEVLEKSKARAVVRGEPERTFLELCREDHLSKIRGVSYREGNRVVHNPDQIPVNLEELLLPAFHLLPMHRYHYEVMGNHFSLFEMSRGCTSHCTFCLLKTYGLGVRKKSIDKVIRELEHGIKIFGVRNAYFFDLEFTILRKQVMEICKYLIQQDYNFSWCCQTRFDLVDEELLGQMKRAGCRLIHFGVEAGSDRMLEILNKGITVKSIREGMKKVKEAGIQTACFFIFGFPESDEQDMANIINFARELNPDYPLFHVAVPYPGTRLYERVRDDSRAYFSDSGLFPEAVIGRFALKELKEMSRRAYLKYYLRPSYILSRLRKGQFRVLGNQLKLFGAFVRG